jgi:hypothetical protein
MADIPREQGVETALSGVDAALAEQRAGVSPQQELKVDDGPDDILRHNRVTVATAGTRISLLGAAVRTREILIKNPLDNSGNPVVYVGGSTVTAANGYPLAKGEAVGIILDNAEDEVYVDASANGTDVVFIATDKDK